MTCQECQRLERHLGFARGDLQSAVRRLSSVAQRRPGGSQELRLREVMTRKKECLTEAKALYQRHIAECEVAA